MLLILFALGLAQAPANGQAIFEHTCATCHTAAGDSRTPSAASLRQRTPEAIIQALTSGPMREQGADLTDAERRAVAAYLGSAAAGGANPPSSAGRCTAVPPFDPSKTSNW